MSDVEQGSCGLCGQCMLRTVSDCWHPWHVEKACPPEDEYGFPMFGTPGRPGGENFLKNGLCGNRDEHEPHSHTRPSLGDLWCLADESQREPARSERRHEQRG